MAAPYTLTVALALALALALAPALHPPYISAAQVAARAAELGLAPPADLAARLLPLVTERMAAAAAAAREAAAAGGGVSSGGGGVSSGGAGLAGCLAEVLLQEAVGRLALRCGDSGGGGGDGGGGGGQGAAGAAAEVALRHADFGLA